MTISPPRHAQKQYSGMGDCFRKTYAREGLGAFYKGFMPNFARLGSWNVVMFLSLEQVKRAYVRLTETEDAAHA
jgi:solute carrier family 25 uncoupling protein 8/9